MISALNDPFADVTLDCVEKRSLEDPTKFHDEDDLYELFARNTSSGVAVTRFSALGFSPVWKGITLIAGDIARVPLVTYRILDEQRGREPDRNHPAYHLLRHAPNEHQTASFLRFTVTADAILHGNGYVFVGIDRRGAPAQLLRLDPRQVTPPDTIGGQYRWVPSARQPAMMIDPDEIVHIRRMTADGIRGIGLLELARETVSLGIAGRLYGSTFFQNNARPDFVVEVPQPLPDRKVTALLEQFDNQNRGLSRSHRPAVLTGGARINPVSITPQEAQLLELRKFQVLEIANFLGIPPHMLAGSGADARSSHNSLESERQTYLDTGLDGWLTAWETELRSKLLTRPQRRGETHTIEFMRESLVKVDLAARSEFYRAALDLGIMSRNEVRKQLNLPSLPGGDRVYVPLNMAPLDDDGRPEQPEPAAPPPAGEDPADSEDASFPSAGRTAIAGMRKLARDAVRRFIGRVVVKAGRQLREGVNVVQWLEVDLERDMARLGEDMYAPAAEALGLQLDTSGLFDLLRSRMLEALEARAPEAHRRLEALADSLPDEVLP